jgi:hypothetical protein
METDFAVMAIRERRYSMRAVVAENFLQFPVSRVMSADGDSVLCLPPG